VFMTTDGGATWVVENTGVADGLSGLVAASPTGVWAVSRAGGIVRRAAPDGALSSPRASAPRRRAR